MHAMLSARVLDKGGVQQGPTDGVLCIVKTECRRTATRRQKPALTAKQIAVSGTGHATSHAWDLPRALGDAWVTEA